MKRNDNSNDENKRNKTIKNTRNGGKSKIIFFFVFFASYFIGGQDN